MLEAFPWEKHVVDVFTIERPPEALHRMLIGREYCVRAILGGAIGDVMYVRKAAESGRLASGSFGEEENHRTPCHSHVPLNRNISGFMRRGDWCEAAQQLGERVSQRPWRFARYVT